MDINELITRLDECYHKAYKITSDEQDYFDNMPENLQGSIRGMESEEFAEYLDNATMDLMEAVDLLKELV